MFLAVLLPVVSALAADKPGPRVELRVRVTTPRKDWDRSAWRIVVRTPAGLPVRDSIVLGGDRASFKKLPPGSYLVCVIGDRGRRTCQTVDATPPPDRKGYRFDLEVETPRAELHQSDLVLVNRHRLAVPPRARDELARADTALLQGDSESVLKHVRRALDICPEFIEALIMLGNYHHSKREFDLAIELFRRVTELDPQYYGGWLNLGGSYLSKGRFQDALATHRRAYELRSGEASVISAVALDYFYLRRYEDAKPYFNQLIARDPAHVNAPQIFLAQIAVMQNRPEEARQYIQAYLELHPNSPRIPELRQWLQRLSSDAIAENLTIFNGP
jgi:Flp pilus assembly protein TadD